MYPYQPQGLVYPQPQLYSVWDDESIKIKENEISLWLEALADNPILAQSTHDIIFMFQQMVLNHRQYYELQDLNGFRCNYDDNSFLFFVNNQLTAFKDRVLRNYNDYCYTYPAYAQNYLEQNIALLQDFAHSNQSPITQLNLQHQPIYFTDPYSQQTHYTYFSTSQQRNLEEMISRRPIQQYQVASPVSLFSVSYQSQVQPRVVNQKYYQDRGGDGRIAQPQPQPQSPAQSQPQFQLLSSSEELPFDDISAERLFDDISAQHEFDPHKDDFGRDITDQRLGGGVDKIDSSAEQDLPDRKAQGFVDEIMQSTRRFEGSSSVDQPQSGSQNDGAIDDPPLPAPTNNFADVPGASGYGDTNWWDTPQTNGGSQGNSSQQLEGGRDFQDTSNQQNYSYDDFGEISPPPADSNSERSEPNFGGQGLTRNGDEIGGFSRGKGKRNGRRVRFAEDQGYGYGDGRRVTFAEDQLVSNSDIVIVDGQNSEKPNKKRGPRSYVNFLDTDNEIPGLTQEGLQLSGVQSNGARFGYSSRRTIPIPNQDSISDPIQLARQVIEGAPNRLKRSSGSKQDKPWSTVQADLVFSNSSTRSGAKISDRRGGASVATGSEISGGGGGLKVASLRGIFDQRNEPVYPRQNLGVGPARGALPAGRRDVGGGRVIQ